MNTDLRFLLQAFDIERYLQSKGIAYSTRGKNVKRGWIGIKCLWCSDRTNHLGINLNSKSISCWKCPVKGTALKLIMRIEGISVKSAIKTLERFSNVSLYVRQSRSNLEQPRASEFKFEDCFTKEIMPYCRRFLENRNFDADYLFKKYKLLSGPIAGEYAYNLIIPYYLNNRPLTFSARHTAKKIYTNLATEKSIFDVKQLLYGYDSCKDTAIVVEGVTDRWRIGDGSVATTGTKFTQRQVELLSEFDRVFILFDPEEEAQAYADKLAYQLVNHCSTVEILDLGVDHDPGDLAPDDVKVLRKQIFSKIYI